ncbi:MAG: hypothetical protein M3N43_01725 [Actinomycetota bacterium]|nr:hypothetical protein [Actinomycetota bacterium]
MKSRSTTNGSATPESDPFSPPGVLRLAGFTPDQGVTYLRICPCTGCGAVVVFDLLALHRRVCPGGA